MNHFLKQFTFSNMAILLCLSLLTFSCANTSTDSQQLFNDNFEPFEMVLPDRSLTDDAPDTQWYNQARAEYSRGEYAAAAKTFQYLSDEAPRSLAYAYYTALSYLSGGDAAKAIPIFQSILEAPRVTLVIHQARWYLAMAYLKENNEAKAKEMLQGIEEGQFKYVEAKALLRKL